MVGRDVNNRLMLSVMIIFVLALCFVCLFTNVCEAWDQDIPEDHRVSVLWITAGYLAERIDGLSTQLGGVSRDLASAREELAEMRGRQNVTTGVAAGTPTGLAGLLFWWLRRERRKKG